MIQYKSNIQITVHNVSPNPEARASIRQAVEAFGSIVKEEGNYDTYLVSLDTTTLGTPEPLFPRLAKAIWWAYEEVCDIEFLVAESKLSYSSPTIFSEPEHKAIAHLDLT